MFIRRLRPLPIKIRLMVTPSASLGRAVSVVRLYESWKRDSGFLVDVLLCAHCDWVRLRCVSMASVDGHR